VTNYYWENTFHVGGEETDESSLTYYYAFMRAAHTVSNP
jgi:hypothetical protein